MKKMFKRTACALAAATALLFAGCGGDPPPPAEDTRTAFPVSTYNGTAPVTMGDVMPFYDEESGELSIYHLQNSGQSPYYHPIARVTTTDFLHYAYEGIAIPFVEEANSPDAAIGTGSFIKDENGLYHCFYTGHNAGGRENSGLPWFECVRHATSPDQKTWTKDEDFSIYGNSNDFRDPYVYYDEAEECYTMLVTTNGDVEGRYTGYIKRYTSSTLSADADEWQDRGVFFANDAGTYNMECPSYVKYGDYYYLAYSEQGENRVTHYRYRTEPDGEWKKFDRDSIDASGFYAGQLELVGEELYAFAWCATLTGGSTGGFDWGGNLVTHRLEQSSNGELSAVPVPAVQEALSAPAAYKTGSGETAEAFSFPAGEFSARAFEPLREGLTRICFGLTVSDFGGDCGVTFGLEEAFDRRLGSAVVAFEPQASRIVCYNNVSNILRYGDVLAAVSFDYDRGRRYEIEILIDGELLTVYADHTVALTARLPDMEENCFAFYSNKAGAAFGGITFYA